MQSNINLETVQMLAPTLAQAKILLVEDDPICQFIHKKMLLQCDCLVEVANNASEALAMIGNGYDLLLLDIGLPDLHGIEVALEIHRREKFHKRTPILVLTAHQEESIQGECLRAGIASILYKPITIVHLKEAIFSQLYPC